MTWLPKKTILVLSAFLSSGALLTNTGCASGGYHLSSEFAGWINSHGVIVRVLLYIFTGGAFFFTIIADMLVFNTLDFWEGKVSQGTYEFKDAEKQFIVKHSFEDKLRKTAIQINDLKGKKLHDVVLMETKNHTIEYYVDGILKAKVDGPNAIRSLPMVSIFNKAGKIIKQETIPANALASANSI